MLYACVYVWAHTIEATNCGWYEPTTNYGQASKNTQLAVASMVDNEIEWCWACHKHTAVICKGGGVKLKLLYSSMCLPYCNSVLDTYPRNYVGMSIPTLQGLTQKRNLWIGSLSHLWLNMFELTANRKTLICHTSKCSSWHVVLYCQVTLLRGLC